MNNAVNEEKIYTKIKKRRVGKNSASRDSSFIFQKQTMVTPFLRTTKV